MPDTGAPDGIFISYRRLESSYLAGWLHDSLADQFGEYRVFLDIDAIRPGRDFLAVIDAAIRRSRVMLVLIGPQWLASGEDGRVRLDDPDDPVRFELETAFRERVRIIPVLLDGAVMPAPAGLPASVAELARLNALRIGYENFRPDFARVAGVVAEELGEAGGRLSEVADDARTSRPGRSRGALFSRTPPDDALRSHEQRRRLLSRLARTYTEYLGQLVPQESGLGIDLGFDWLPQKTARPQDLVPGVPDERRPPLPAGTSLLHVFDRAGGVDGDGLLVVGGPGSGKTTLLFELARELVARARADPRLPVPVYLPLSSWGARRGSFLDWSVEQLADLYQVPYGLSRSWIADGELLFLLDGLDEIPEVADRRSCVVALNSFNRFGHACRVPVVVASRLPEYDALGVRLRLEAAVEVCALDPSTVLGLLDQAGGELGRAAEAVRHDPELRELLVSPLLVNMLTLASVDPGDTAVLTAADGAADLRLHLIARYVDRRLSRDGPYPARSTVSWLSTLATNLSREQQTVLLVGRLSNSWVPARWARLVVMVSPAVLAWAAGTTCTAIVLALWNPDGDDGFGLLDALSFALESASLVGLGIWFGLFALEPSAPRRRFSWARVRARLPAAALLSVICGVGTGALGQWSARQPGWAAAGIAFGLAGLVIAWVGPLRPGLPAGLAAGLGGGVTTAVLVGAAYHDDLAGALNPALWALLEAGAVPGLAGGLIGEPRLAERLSWSWRQARRRSRTTLTVGLTIALGITSAFSTAGSTGWGVGIGSAVALGLWLVGGMTAGLIPLHFAANEAVYRSIRNGLVAAVLVGLVVGTAVGLVVVQDPEVGDAVTAGVVAGSVPALIAGVAYGLGGAVQHGLLRVFLWVYRIAPLRYVDWLDHAVSLRLLYRGAGGGYLFVHKLVQDYFAGVPDRVEAGRGAGLES